MIASLVVIGSLVMSAEPALDVDGERFQLASANLALDSIRADIQLVHTRAEDPKMFPRITKNLDVLLTAVGEQRAIEIAKSEGQTFKAKLIAMALDRKNQTKLYEELGKIYGSDEYESELPNGVKIWDARALPNRLPIRKAHTGVEYRLVWEFRLLFLPGMKETPLRSGSGKVGGFSKLADIRPSVPGFIHECAQPTMEGLFRTGNEKSIVTIVEFYKAACRDDVGHQHIADQTICDLFGCLEHYGTAKALVAILECAEWTEVQWDTFYARYAKKSGTTPQRTEKIKPIELVTDLSKTDDKQVWLKLAEKLPTETLTKRQKEMLTALKEMYIKPKDSEKK